MAASCSWPSNCRQVQEMEPSTIPSCMRSIGVSVFQGLLSVTSACTTPSVSPFSEPPNTRQPIPCSSSRDTSTIEAPSCRSGRPSSKSLQILPTRYLGSVFEIEALDGKVLLQRYLEFASGMRATLRFGQIDNLALHTSRHHFPFPRSWPFPQRL